MNINSFLLRKSNNINNLNNIIFNNNTTPFYFNLLNNNLNNGISSRFTTYLTKFHNNLEKFSLILGKIFQKKVEFEIIKLHFPFHDSNILASILGFNSKKYKFNRMIKLLLPRAVIKNPSRDISYIEKMNSNNKNINNNILPLVHNFNYLDYYNPSSYLPPLFSNLLQFKYLKNNNNDNLISSSNSKSLLFNSILSINETETKTKTKTNFFNNSKINKGSIYPSYLSGINIRLAGRLLTQSLRPRFTVQNKQEGSLARVKVHYIEKSRFTSKNKRGAFSFTVTISHVFN